VREEEKEWKQTEKKCKRRERERREDDGFTGDGNGSREES